MRCFVLAALLPIACLASAQDTSVHVTYETRAAHASDVVRALGQLAKLDLQTSPQTQDEVLVISVKDIPLSDVMARIATVTSGEWKHEGAIYRLTASSVVRKQEERDSFAKKTALVRKAIAKRLENDQTSIAAMAKAAATAEAAAKAKSAQKTDPKDKKKTDVAEDDTPPPTFITAEETAISGLLKGIDPSVLAQIDTGDRMVFSTEPTRTQRNLAQDATEILNEFIQKHDATASDTPPDISNQLSGLTDQQAEMVKQMMSKQKTGKIGAASKALLVVSTSNMGMMGMMGMAGTLSIELRIYDAKGKVTFSTNSTLDLTENNRFAAMMAAATQPDGPTSATEPSKQPTPKAKTTPIEYSEDSKALIQSLKGFSTGKFTVQFTRELRQKLFLPSMYDPLSFVQTDELLAYSKSKGRPLVANVPDHSDESFSPFGQSNSKTVESYSKDIEKGEEMVSVPDDTFTVIKPADPVGSREHRLDRIALTALLQATDAKGIPSLDDIATFALASTNPMEGGVGQLYLLLFVPGSMPMGFDGLTSWDMLKFYGTLSPDARRSLATGGKIAMSSLSSGQRNLVERMTYGAGAQLTIEDPNKKADDDIPSFLKMAMEGGGATDDYRGEPTEVVPNGLPNDGFIEMKSNTEPFAAPIPGSDSSIFAMLGVLGPDELALFKMLRSTPGAEAMDAMLPKFPKLRAGESSIFNFTFNLAPQVSIKQSLKDHRLSGDGTIFSEDNLPADLKKRVADKTEALKKSPFGAMGSFMGGTGAIHP